MRNILFVCTGNSCRSQMAEGWARHLGSGLVEARSAGIEAHGQNPRAIAAMSEVDVDISRQDSTQLTTGMLEWADLVVTVCGHAVEHCPVLPATTRKQHWPINDPATVTDDEDTVVAVFGACRDEIRQRVEDLLVQIGE